MNISMPVPEMKELETQTTDKMTKTISLMKEEFATVRAGRANPQVLDKIQVAAYGSLVPLQQVGNLSVPEPRMLLISVWDVSLVKEVEKAIQKSDLGLNPTTDGKTIRLLFPEPTEERRRELVKNVRKIGENAKISVRNIRRDSMDVLKRLKKDNAVSEDEQKKGEEALQKITDQKIKEIDTLTAAKEKEIMEI